MKLWPEKMKSETWNCGNHPILYSSDIWLWYHEKVDNIFSFSYILYLWRISIKDILHNLNLKAKKPGDTTPGSCFISPLKGGRKMKKNNHKVCPSNSEVADKFKIILSLLIALFVFHKNEEYVYLRVPKEFLDRL